MSGDDTVIGAFSEEQASQLSGVSRWQLRDWDRIGLLRPSYGAEETGLPYGRIYSFRDLVSLRVLQQLRHDHKIGIGELLRTAKELSQLSDDPWASTILYVLRRKVVIRQPGSPRKVEVVGGQRVLDLPLRVVVASMRKAVERLNERGEAEVGRIVRDKFVVQNQPVLAGTRIPVAAIKSFAAAGYDVGRILKEYPDLEAADVKAAIAYEGEGAAA